MELNIVSKFVVSVTLFIPLLNSEPVLDEAHEYIVVLNNCLCVLQPVVDVQQALVPCSCLRSILEH